MQLCTRSDYHDHSGDRVSSIGSVVLANTSGLTYIWGHVGESSLGDSFCH